MVETISDECSLTTTGHCYLMMDDLQQAYSAYQQALYHLRDPKVDLSIIHILFISNLE